MTTWVDPDFGGAVMTAALMALGRVIDSSPSGVRVQLDRIFAHDNRAADGARGDEVAIHRSPIVGHGHENIARPKGEVFLFVARRDESGALVGYTDSFWTFDVGDDERVHMPIRDPFTRAYVLFDDLSELVPLMRDRRAPAHVFLSRQAGRLATTPVAATQPIEVNEQIVALESFAHLGTEKEGAAALPFLESPHYQIRWSAVRALGTCGGPQAARAVLDRLAREDTPPVQAAIGEALWRLADPSMRGEIEAALPKVHAESMPYSRNIMSPIMNMMPSPRGTLNAVLRRLS
jgi:hypothetical protein